MAVLKCKMCGGDIIAVEGQTYGTCDSCGSTVTLPNVNDQRMENLFNRANHFRIASEFDKAVATYEMILNEDNSNAEAHWGLLLSRYGIEYVEDPTSHERIPTCHRIQREPILTDDDYLAAVQHAPDGYTRSLYEAEGKRLSELQRGLLQVSAQTEPFDIFICYKETTEGGSRTNDSALAQDIYYQLTNAGYKVFFSRVTLESMLGQQYEPHIFAALNSAKVMLAIGTKPEYFNAVWVKNEWSRFLALSKKDHSKVLIPCYRDMNVYDLPDELSMLQSQDMNKIGFIQDLLHGIEKVIGIQKKEEIVQTVQNVSTPGVESLYKRATLFLEDGNFAQAQEYFDRILDIDPEYAPAYIGKVCVTRRVYKEADLKDCKASLDGDSSYKKAIRFADPQQKAVYEGYNAAIHDRNNMTRLESIYKEAQSYMQRATGEDEFRHAASFFAKIGSYKDAEVLKDKCLQKAESARIEYERREAAQKVLEEQKRAERQQREEQLKLEQQRQAEIDRIAAEKKKAARKRTTLIIAFIAVITAGAGVLTTQVIIPNKNYNQAATLLENKSYAEAVAAFTAMDGYKDSNTQIQIAYYRMGLDALNSGDLAKARESFVNADGYDDSTAQIQNIDNYTQACVLIDGGDDASARALLISLGNYRDSATLLQGCYEREYANALSLYNSGDYAGAYASFTQISEYSDSMSYAQQMESDYQAAEALLSEGSYDEAAAAFTALNNYADSAEKVSTSIYTKAESLFAAGSYDAAAATYASLSNYADSEGKVNLCHYSKAEALREAGSYDEAIAVYSTIPMYRDSASKISECHYQNALTYLANDQQYEAEAEFAQITDYSDAAARLASLRLGIADTAFADKDYALALEYYLKLDQTDELKAKEYAFAQICYDEGYFEQAVLAYEALGQYELSVSKLPVARYAYASQLFDNTEYAKAAEQFTLLNGSTDSAERTKESTYLYGKQQMEQELWDDAKATFNSIAGYNDASAMIKECDYLKAAEFMTAGSYAEARTLFESLDEYSDSITQAKECGYQIAEMELAAGNYAAAQTQYESLNGYSDSANKIKLCIYEQANVLVTNGDYASAETMYVSISEYEDSAEKVKLCRYEQGNACYTAQDYTGALTFYTDLDYSDSENLAAQCHCELGKAYLAVGNSEDAVREYAQATILPEAQEMLYSTGKDFVSTNQIEKAIEALYCAGEYAPAQMLLAEIGETIDADGDIGMYYLYVCASSACNVAPEEIAEMASLIDGDTITRWRGTLSGTHFTQYCLYQYGCWAQNGQNYELAIEAFEEIAEHQDVADRLPKCQYELARMYEDNLEYNSALQIYTQLNDYRDSRRRAADLYSMQLAIGRAIVSGADSYGFVKTSGFDVDCNTSDWRNIVAIDAGYGILVGLKADGTVISTGMVNQDYLVNWNDIVAIEVAGDFTFALKSDGTVAYTEGAFSSALENRLASWKNITAIDVNTNGIIAGLRANGRVVVVGRNSYDMEKFDVSDWRDIIAISVGHEHLVGLKSDGTVVATGDNSESQCNVQDWKDIVAISAGSQFTLGLKKDGTVVAVGRNDNEQCEVSDWNDVVQVVADYGFSVGLTSDGKVHVACTSYDKIRDAREWTDIVGIRAENDCILGLKADGTVEIVGDDRISSYYSSIDQWNLLK